MYSQFSPMLETLKIRLTGLVESTSSIVIADDGHAFKQIFPGDPTNQTYDSYIVGDNNGKKVTKAAIEGLLKASAEHGPELKSGSFSLSKLIDFVDAYVQNEGKQKGKRVKWNSKSYPD